MVHALDSTDASLSGHNKSCNNEDANHFTHGRKQAPFCSKGGRFFFNARKCAKMHPVVIASVIKTLWRSMHGFFYPATLSLYKVANLV